MAMLNYYFQKTYIRQLIFTADGMLSNLFKFLWQSADFLYKDISASSEPILML